MNIRKAIDYTTMYAALDDAVTANRPQMELYCEIGKIICERTERGAAVAAAEYLKERHPNAGGFSPRNVRRMRDFYRLYGEYSEMLTVVLRLSWTQNVVLLEAELSMSAREWCIYKACENNPSRAEMQNMVDAAENEKIALDQPNEYWYNRIENNTSEWKRYDENSVCLSWEYYKKVSKSLIPKALIVYICQTYTRFTHFALNMGNEPMVYTSAFCMPFHIYMAFNIFSEPRIKSVLIP